MEPSSSSSRRYLDSHGQHMLSGSHFTDRNWPSSPRETLNPSLSTHPSSSNLSQHMAALASSAQASAWSSNLNLGPGNSNLLDELANQNLGLDLSANLPNSFNGDWANAFTSPIQSSSFSALGNIVSVSSSPINGQLSLPGSFHNSYHPPVPDTSNTGTPASWSQAPSPLSQKYPSPGPSKVQLPRSNSYISEAKGKALNGMFITSILVRLYLMNTKAI